MRLGLVLLAGCVTTSAVQAPDASQPAHDAGRDASQPAHDAGRDAGLEPRDAGRDASQPAHDAEPAATCSYIPECGDSSCSVAYGAMCGEEKLGTFACEGVQGFVTSDEQSFPCAGPSDCAAASQAASAHCAELTP